VTRGRATRSSTGSKRRRAPAKPAAKPPLRLVAHIDGGARGNPGPAGYGVHVEDESGGLIAQLYGYLGIATNNTAEYAGLLAALEYALDTGAASLQVYSDSELLVRQIEGRYRVKDPKMRVLFAAAKGLIARLQAFSVAHVPREQNREADMLANKAMDRRESSGDLPAGLRDLPETSRQGTLLP
jgi:ribonuclease HI